MPRRAGGRQQIANLDCSVPRIHFAEDFAQQRNRFSHVIGLLLVQHDAGLVTARTGDHPGDSFIIGLLARVQGTFLAQDHDRSGLNLLRFADIEILGAIGVEQTDVASDLDIALEVTSQSPTFTMNTKPTVADAYHACAVAFVFTPNTRTTHRALGFTINAHPCLADSYDACANRVTHHTGATCSAFALAVDPHPSLTFPNDTGTPSGIHTIYAKSTGRTFAKSFNTMPSFAIPSNTNSAISSNTPKFTLAMYTKRALS